LIGMRRVLASAHAVLRERPYILSECRSMRVPIPVRAGALRLCLASLAVAMPAAHAGDADPDPTFADGGFAFHAWPADTIQAQATAGAITSDGRVIAAGWISYPSPQQHFATTLLRYRSDGTPDPAFGDDGLARLDLDPAPHVNETIQAVFPQPSGKLLAVAGIQAEGEMAFRPVLLSVLPDGAPDTAFGAGGMRPIDISQWSDEGDVQIRTAAMQPDGKILVAGILVTDSGYHILLGRLLPDASPDAGFSGDGWMENGSAGIGDRLPEAVAVDDVGRILVVGRIDDGPVDRPLVLRLTPDGEYDTGFGPFADGGLMLEDLDGSWTARSIVSAKRIVAGGQVQRRLFLAISANSPNRTAVAAITDGGALATTFGDDGFVDLTREEGSRITALAMRDDRRLVAAGFIDPNGTGTGTDLFVARMDFAGTLDSTFSGNGVERYPLDPAGTTYDSVATLLLSAQRPVIVGAAFDNTTPRTYSAVMRLQSDAIFADGVEP
jgi:uncharacterized delta-60 repeat protein